MLTQVSNTMTQLTVQSNTSTTHVAELFATVVVAIVSPLYVQATRLLQTTLQTRRAHRAT